MAQLAQCDTVSQTLTKFDRLFGTRARAGLLIEPPPAGPDDVAVAAIPTPPPGLPPHLAVPGRQAPASGAEYVPERFAFEALGKRFQKNLRRVT